MYTTLYFYAKHLPPNLLIFSPFYKGIEPNFIKYVTRMIMKINDRPKKMF